MKTSHRRRGAAAFIAWLVAANAAGAAGVPCTARSSARTTPLLELYTSEGCSSCPPAERLLSDLPGIGVPAGAVVPLALHVDYWDDLGWKDPFAQPAFSQRQHRLAQRDGAVYTPQFLLQGRPYGAWLGASRLANDIGKFRQEPARADISLQIETAGETLPVTLSARLRNPRQGEHAQLFAVLFENHLVSRVTAGENRGALLTHDFVARAWAGPWDLPPGGGEHAVTHAFRLGRDWQRGNLGVAAFVQSASTGEVLQAVSSGLCGIAEPRRSHGPP